MRAKKAMALLLTAAMTAGMLAGCGDTADTASGTKTESAAAADAQGTETSDLAGTQITLLNSKAEIQTALEEMAEVFTEDTGIELEVQGCATGESPYTKVTSAYNSGAAPTMAILDTTDVEAQSMRWIFLMRSGHRSVSDSSRQWTEKSTASRSALRDAG